MYMVRFHKFDPNGDASYLSIQVSHDRLMYIDEERGYGLWKLRESIKVTKAIRGLLTAGEENPLLVYFVPGLKMVAVHNYGYLRAEILVTEISGSEEIIHVYSRDFEEEAKERRIMNLKK